MAHNFAFHLYHQMVCLNRIKSGQRNVSPVCFDVSGFIKECIE